MKEEFHIGANRYKVITVFVTAVTVVQQANGWTPERRQRQSEAIRRWQPWEKSTGPRTTEGKAQVAQNAYKGGERVLLRRLAKILRSQQKEPEELRAKSPLGTTVQNNTDDGCSGS